MTEPKLLIDPEITVPTSTTPFIKQDPEAEVELPNEMANVKVKVDPEIEIHISSSSSSSSPSKKRSHEEMQPLASAPTNIKPPTSTPFETSEKEFHDFRKQYDLKTSIPHIIWSVSDPVQEVHGKWEVQEWGEERKKEEESKLTQADIDLHHHAMILPRSTYTLFGLRSKEITYADTRNDPSDCMVMLNTYSSWCMYPVLQKQLIATQKLLNKAKKNVKATGESKLEVPSSSSSSSHSGIGIAAQAFASTIASVFAADRVDHWRNDTEDTDECAKINKLASKALQTMLWFSDAELGIQDPFTRKAVLKFCEKMDWDACGQDVGGIKYKTKQNGEGLGREHAPAPPPTKRRKVAAVAPTSGLSLYLHGLHANGKLKQRVKTYVQCVLTSLQDNTNKTRFVVSGATSMKKIGQLCAFLTGNASSFQYHSQKGTNVKGSKIILRNEDQQLFLAGKAAAKKLLQKTKGAEFVEDKTVKIVQVFQGLCIGAQSGMQYDSELARNMNTVGKVVFQVPSSSSSLSSSSSSSSLEFALTVEGVVPMKCSEGKDLPCPRLVSTGAYDINEKTAYGRSLHRINGIMQGDRQGPGMYVGRGTSQAKINMMGQKHQSKQLCGPDGKIVYASLMHGDFDFGRTLALTYWNAKNVATAGPP